MKHPQKDDFYKLLRVKGNPGQCVGGLGVRGWLGGQGPRVRRAVREKEAFRGAVGRDQDCRLIPKENAGQVQSQGSSAVGPDFQAEASSPLLPF